MRTLKKRLIISFLALLTALCACISIVLLTNVNKNNDLSNTSYADTQYDAEKYKHVYTLGTGATIDNGGDTHNFWANGVTAKDLVDKGYFIEFDSTNSSISSMSITSSGRIQQYTFSTSASIGKGLTVTDNGDGWYHYYLDIATMYANKDVTFASRCNYDTNQILGLRNMTGANLTIANVVRYTALEKQLTNVDYTIIGTDKDNSGSSKIDGRAVVVDYVSASSEGLTGVTGTVAKITKQPVNGQNGGWSSVALDFSASKVDLNRVKSMTVKTYMPKGSVTANSDQVRPYINSAVAGLNTAHTENINSGFTDIVLSKKEVSGAFKEDGTQGVVLYSVRASSYNVDETIIFYIAGITFEYYDSVLVGLDPVEGVGPWGWNNNTTALQTGALRTLLTFRNKNTGDKKNPVADTFNYAQLPNSISLGMKLNGTSFYDLYKTDNKYAIHSTQAYLTFEIPESANVNGAILTIDAGSNYQDIVYDYVKIINNNGTWAMYQKHEDIAPIGFLNNANYNNKTVGGVPSVVLTFDVTDFNAGDVQINPSTFSGIYLNGTEIAKNKLVLWNTNRLWIQYTDADKVAGVNGYSHPTITFKNATFSNPSNTYTVNDFNLYLNSETNLWQFDEPAGYKSRQKEIIANDGIFIAPKDTKNGGACIDGGTSTLTYLDAETEGIAGATGMVLKVESGNATYKYLTLDATAANITASDVCKVIVRAWIPNGGASDMLMTNGYDGSIGNKGIHNGFVDIALPASHITKWTLDNGKLGKLVLDFSISSSATFAYIDSIKVFLYDNFNPSFVEVAETANRAGGGTVEVTQMSFNTKEFIIPAVGVDQHNVEAFSGITINGEPVDQVRVVGTNLINFVHSKAKEEANYNDYSHATFKIAEGATITNEGRVFTFHAQTLYVDYTTGKWTTAKPSGYVDGALYKEFTNNGQFTVSLSNWNSAISFVDTTGLPSGCSGAVLKLGSAAGTEGAKFDFSNAHIKASDVESITVRIYSPNYSSTTDEFRTTINSGASFRQYGFGAIDMSNWVDITLNANSMNDLASTGTNGELGWTWIGVRSTSGTPTYYIDSVTINLKPTKTPNVSITEVGPWGWNNSGHSHNTGTPAGTRWTILQCSSNPTASATNVAATDNSTSRGVKLNGTSFYEWYQQDNRFALNSALGHFMWQVPEEYSEGAVITIDEGTEYDTLVFPASTFYFNGSVEGGGWDTAQFVDNGKEAYFDSIYPNASYNSATSLLLVFNTSDGGTFDNTAVNTAKFSVNANGKRDSNRAVNYWAGTKWMNIALGAGLNITEGSKLTVYDGTVFGGYVIKGTYTFTFTSGAWVVDPIYDDVYFTGFFNDPTVYNNKHIGQETYWSVFITFNVSDFALPDEQTRPNASGVYLNGNPIPNNLLTLWNANRFWIRYTDADKVANVNGYSHPTIEFKDATITSTIGKTYTINDFKIYLNLDTQLWQTAQPNGYQYVPGNFTPSFVRVSSDANRFDAGANELTQMVFDTESFIVPAVGVNQHNVEAFSGITVNGEPVSQVRVVATSKINFVHPQAKEVAWYNGYSHATFVISEGATITNEGRVFTFHAQTLYCVDGKWTTTQPSGYMVVTTTSTFDSIDSSSTATSLVLKYTDNATWVNNLGNLANNILLDGGAFNGTISVNTTNKTITFNLVSSVSTLSINAESVCGGVKIPTKTFFYFNDAWSLHHAPTVTMTADGIGPWGWNNADHDFNGAVPEGTIWTLIPFSCGTFSYDATNLIVTNSEVASMIKFNGKTFGELYANNNLYAFTTQLGHPMFQIPKADLVAGNGYDYPTVEIEAGLPVGGQYLPAVTAVLINGVWMEKPNFEPTMTAFSEADANLLFVLAVDFDTKNFVVPQETTTRNVLASNGFTFNGEEIYDVRTIDKGRIWFVENKTKRVADYNGYSHPTFEIAEGATLTDSANNVFTFHALTLYYVDNVWTTVKPNGYYTSIILLGVDETYNNNRTFEDGYSCTFLNFAEEIGAWTGNNIKGNFTLNGSALPNDAVVQVGYNGTQLDKLWIKIPNSSLTTADATSHLTTLRWNSFTLENGNIFTGNLFLVDGKWVTQTNKTYITVSYEDRGNGSGTNGLLWNNHDYGDVSGGNPVYVDLGVELGAVFLLNVSAYPLSYLGETDPRINLISDTNDVGNRIWLNGKAKLKDVPNAGCTIAVGFLYFNVPTYVEYIEIEAGTVIGNYVMEHTIIYYSSAWSLTPTVYIPVSYDATTELYGMAWNNYDYNGYDLPYGETMTGTPSNGVAGLLKFDQYYFTDARYDNMANEFTDVGSKMKFGGIAVKDIPGAYVACPAAGQFLYFYIPHSGLDAVGVDYSWFTLTLEQCHVYNMEIPGIVYYFYDTQFHDLPATQVNLSYNGDMMSKRLNGETTIDFDYIQDMLSMLYSDLKPFVWTYNGTPYTANTPFVVDGTADINITLDQVVGIETDVGASIRLTNDTEGTGLMFTTRIQNDSLTFLSTAYGGENIEIGTIIAPRKYIDAYFAENSGANFKGFITDAGNKGKFMDISNRNNINNDWHIDMGIKNSTSYEDDGYVTYSATLNVKPINYNVEFYGVGYIKVTNGGVDFYVFGSNVINANTRTIYKVAKSAYLDTASINAMQNDADKEFALTALEGYLDRVIDINLINGVASLANDFSSVYPERNYVQAYKTVYGDDGVLYVTNFKKDANENFLEAAGTYILNGQRLSVEGVSDGTTAPSGSETPWSFAVKTATIAEYLKTVNYGIGEPSRNVWTTGHEAGDPNTSQAMLAEVVGKNGFNATAFRVWMNAGLPKVGAGNTVTLGQSESDDLELMLEELVKNNVKEIYLQMSLAPASTYPIHYAQNKTTKQYEWVTADKINNTHYAPIYMDNNTVPYWETNTLNADDSPQAYSDWLTVQYKYFKLLTEQLSEWANEKNWSGVKIIFEGVNEPEGENPAHRRGQYNVSSLTYSYAYFDNEQLARVLTDVSYYNTLAIKNTTFDTDKLVMKVATPALTDLWLGQASTVMASGVYADSLAREMTNAIKDNVAPTAIDGITPANSNNPNDYYTVLNWHPYISWLKEDNNFLYYGEIKETTSWFKTTKKAVINENYIANWKAWNLAMYNLLTDGFTDYTPDVVFTELGAFDFGTHPTDKLKTLGVNNALVASTIINGLIKAIPEIGFKGSTTVIYFRLCDMETQYAQEGHGTPGNPDYFATAEGNAGLLEENGQLKTSAIAYYELINGNKNTTALQAIINKYWNN